MIDKIKSSPPLTIAIEGINGSGKTTLIGKLKEILVKEGIEPVELPYKKTESYKKAISATSDLKDKLFIEAFKESYKEVFPNLKANNILIMDRFLLSNFVYRTIDGYKLDPKEQYDKLLDLGNGEKMKVDTFIYLDCNPNLAYKRIIDRGEDRFKNEYLELETLEKARTLFIDYYYKLVEDYKDSMFFLTQTSKFNFFRKYRKFINNVYSNRFKIEKVQPFCYF